MEAFALYLLKSAVWLAGFMTVYLLFLRNERFFTLNRFFLLAGILASSLMPLLTVRYSVLLPAPEPAITTEVSEPLAEGISVQSTPSPRFLLLLVYMSGVVSLVSVMVWQSRLLLLSVVKAGGKPGFSGGIIRNHNFTTSFSFFSWIFVNPSATEIEAREIVNHELVHIRQRHWIDLALVWMLCVFQWFNPLAWLYSRLIRQNHEFIADEAALQQTDDPAVYRATLLNQAAGAQLVVLVNSFNYSLTKKRFEMMKNIISSPYRKLKILTILPVFALVLFAFSEPEYSYGDTETVKSATGTIQDKTVKGTAFQSDSRKPMENVIVILKGTTIGTPTDANGRFKLENVPEDGALVVTHVGYKSKVIKPVFGRDMEIPMERDTIDYGYFIDPAAPPPPPPPPPSGSVKKEPVVLPLMLDTKGDALITKDKRLVIKSASADKLLTLFDGRLVDLSKQSLEPEKIKSIGFYRDGTGEREFGEYGKQDLIVIISRKPGAESETNKPGYYEVFKTPPGANENIPFVVVEEMPEFPGGKKGLLDWINQNIRYPEAARQQKIEGKVVLRLVVYSTGKVGEISVLRSDNAIFNEEALRMAGIMPDWKPGSQNGKKVDVYYMIPVEFKLR